MKHGFPTPEASRPNGQGNDSNMLPTWAWRLTLAWAARGPLKVARECDPGMRQEFASENKPKTGSNASVSLTKRTQFNRGAGKSLNIVFSRGLRAARTGGVVAAIPFACHTVRRRQRKNLLPNNPPLGFSLGTVTTTETLSTEATPEHHRGCFNAPRSNAHSPSPPTPIGDLRDILQTVIPGENRNPQNRLSGAGRNPGGWVGSPSVAHEEVGPATSRNRIPGKCRNPRHTRHPRPRSGTCHHIRSAGPGTLKLP